MGPRSRSDKAPAWTRKAVTVGSVFLTLGASSLASATQVTFRVLDQLGQSIPGSTILVDSQELSQGDTISLTPGPYAVFVRPGRDGSPGVNRLERVDSLEVAGESQLADFVWRTGLLTVRIVDQNDVPIPASQCRAPDLI